MKRVAYRILFSVIVSILISLAAGVFSQLPFAKKAWFVIISNGFTTALYAAMWAIPATFILVFAHLLIDVIREVRRADKFKEIFGIEADSDPNYQKTFQPQIDQTLISFAQSYDKAQEKMKEHDRKVYAAKRINNLNEAVTSFKTDQKDLELKKNQFLEALDLAKRSGFTVKKSHKDYLTMIV